MKYLKEYFSHRNYIEMSDVEWENSIWTPQDEDYNIAKSIFFGRDKFRKLNTLIKKWNLLCSEMTYADVKKIKTVSLPNRSVMIHSEKRVPIAVIVRLEDEWYYIWNRVKNTFYKCDQWDELEECIEDNLSNNFFNQIGWDKFVI